MSKSTYIRAYANTDQGKVLETAEKIMEKLGLPAKSFYFPSQPNENGYYSCLIRLPDGMSELKLRARISWALQ
jgi:hypothetical protein